MDTKTLYWLSDNYKRPLLNNRHMFYQLLVNKTLSFINNRPMFYQLIVNKNTIFYDDQRLQRQFDGLLMMGIIMPETCWAVSVRQSNKILRLIVASSWVFYLSDWRCTEPQTLNTAFPLAITHFFFLERLTLDLWILRLHSGFAVPCLLALTHTRTHTRKTLT